MVGLVHGLHTLMQKCIYCLHNSLCKDLLILLLQYISVVTDEQIDCLVDDCYSSNIIQ